MKLTCQQILYFPHCKKLSITSCTRKYNKYAGNITYEFDVPGAKISVRVGGTAPAFKAYSIAGKTVKKYDYKSAEDRQTY